MVKNMHLFFLPTQIHLASGRECFPTKAFLFNIFLAILGTIPKGYLQSPSFPQTGGCVF